ncbi:hypothetical protein [Halobellus rarus]|uniref:Uncharacterized protein n=1 Tax=Halobellus rarus TaxID=1126237 RepID=A0ABD6CMS9_9EURY|nr:hypothetical protein [Halobellus rarus]
MCYHAQRREALAELEHETGARGADDERADDGSGGRADDPELPAQEEPTEEHRPDAPENADRPEPVGFA